MGSVVDIDWWRKWGRGDDGEEASKPLPPEELDRLYAAFSASEYAGGTMSFDSRLAQFLETCGLRPIGAAAERLKAEMWQRHQARWSGRRLMTGPHERLPEPT